MAETKYLTMKLMAITILASLAYGFDLVDECPDNCCTLRITRPPGDEDTKYSGTYFLNEGVYVKEDNSDTIELIESELYDYDEEDYVDFENWGIMDGTSVELEGGLTIEEPVGNWPNGGEAECLETNNNGVCETLLYTHERVENGIYDEIIDDYGAQFGFREWKQRDNERWFFSFNDIHEEHNVHEGGFSEFKDQDFWNDYSDDKSGGTLAGVWTDGTNITCIG